MLYNVRNIFLRREICKKQERSMVIFVLGGSGSGKSEYAESLAVRLGQENVLAHQKENLQDKLVSCGQFSSKPLFFCLQGKTSHLQSNLTDIPRAKSHSSVHSVSQYEYNILWFQTACLPAVFCGGKPALCSLSPKVPLWQYILI